MDFTSAYAAEHIHQGVDEEMEGTGVISRLITHRSLHVILAPRVLHASARVSTRITALRGSPRGQAGALGGICPLEGPKYTSSGGEGTWRGEVWGPVEATVWCRQAWGVERLQPS